MSHKRFIARLALGLLSLIACLPSAHAWRHGDLKTLAWLPQGTMRYVYDDRNRSPHLSEPETIQHIMNSLRIWASCGLQLDFLGRITEEEQLNNLPSDVTLIRWTHKNGAAAWTKVSVEQGRIYRAVIELGRAEDEDGTWSTKNYLLTAIAHEIGHTLGMKHVPYCDAVMGSCGYASSTLPSSYDIWSCKAHYTRRDSILASLQGRSRPLQN